MYNQYGKNFSVLFFNIGMNYEQSKTMSICSKTTCFFNILLAPTNKYEGKIQLNPYFYSKIQNNKKIMTNFKIFEKEI